MPIVNGNYYMNGDYGQSLEQAKIADAFPGLAAQTGSSSWADRLVDHLTTPRSATAPPPPSAPPGMPPEAYDYMKINQLTVRQVANVVANEDRNVTRGASSPEDFYQSKLWKAHTVINGDRTFGDQRDNQASTASKEVDPELENSPQYQQALGAARQAFQEQLAGKDPIGGRIWFNNRPTDSTAPRILNTKDPEHSTVGVNRVFGPYQYRNEPIFTDTNENLKNTPPRGKL